MSDGFHELESKIDLLTQELRAGLMQLTSRLEDAVGDLKPRMAAVETDLREMRLREVAKEGELKVKLIMVVVGISMVSSGVGAGFLRLLQAVMP